MAPRFPGRATALAGVVIVAVHPAAAPLAAGGRSPGAALVSPRAAMVNDGIMSFLVLLSLLLVMSLFAVIRLPRWAGPPDGDDKPAPPVPARPALPPAPRHARPGHAWPAPVWPVPAWPVPSGSRPAGTQSGAEPELSFPVALQPGQPDPAARPAADRAGRPAARPVHGRGTVRSPKVSGSPPWEPASRPPDRE